ncbi:MAG: hypothetical protein AAB575_00205 [Patescibacteria group bacterium]
MYNIFGVLLFVTLSVTSYYLRGCTETENWMSFWMSLKIFFAGVAVIYAIIVFFYNLSEIGEQRCDFEVVRRDLKHLNILKKKTDTLKPIFTRFLSDRYPEFEEKILTMLAHHEPGLHGVATDFPELKSVEGFKALVEQIDQLYSACYKEQLVIMDTMNRINQRLVYPFLINSLMPAVPDDLVDITSRFAQTMEK